MPEGYNHAEAIPRVIEQTAKAMVEERPVAAMGRIKEVYDDDQRAVVELMADPAAQINNVPVTVPYLGDGTGDVLPISPGVKGIVLFLDHPVGEQLAEDGTETDSVGMDLEDAVFLPATFGADRDDPPEHESGDRVIGHPSGSRIDWDGDGRLRMRHTNGMTIEIGAEPEVEFTHRGDRPPETEVRSVEDMTESEKRFYLGVEDNTEYPAGNPGEVYARLDHPDDAGVTVTRRGVALGNHGRGPREVFSGRPNQPDRVELDGHHQHVHVIEHDNGEFSLAGPPLTFREFLAWMTDGDRQSSLRNADAYADARSYAESYLAWLEDEVGREIDPTDPDDWPHREPMPTPDEREEFDQ